MKQSPTLYFDYAAGAPLTPRVRRAMEKAMHLEGNPSSFHDSGREARAHLEESRRIVARFLGARPDEIIFTASGSESNNLALRGSVYAQKKGIFSIITTPIEHPSILETVKALHEQTKTKVHYLRVDREGRAVVPEDTRWLLGAHLISVMYANNEVGTIQPIREIAQRIASYKKKNKGAGPVFHIDACQATGYLPMNVRQLGADLLTLNGSKIGGPRGVGVLYVRRGVRLAPIIYGGHQESGLRAGTENIPAIVGLAQAIQDVDSKEKVRLSRLQDMFCEGVQRTLPDVRVNGVQGENRLPNNVHISIPDLESEAILLELDKYGIRAGSGSACTSHSVEPSHVLKAMKVSRRYLSGAIRFSMGHQTKREDIEYVVKILPRVIDTIRKRYQRL